jgi:hypothetical protein
MPNDKLNFAALVAVVMVLAADMRAAAPNDVEWTGNAIRRAARLLWEAYPNSDDGEIEERVARLLCVRTGRDVLAAMGAVA